MKRNNGNSGLYGRVTKKQMGGAAKPVGMSGGREIKMPGGGRLAPPEMGPNPDAERMGPRRFQGMNESIIDALGIKSDAMSDKSRNEPPRPKTTGGRTGR